MKQRYLYLMGLTVLLLAIVVACAPGPLAQPVPEEGVQPEVIIPPAEAEPPVLEEVMTESELYAANPELMAAGRYAELVAEETMTESELYAANPELMAAGRYAGAVTEANAFPRTEQELQFARRYLETNTYNQSLLDDYLDANPELRFIRRYLEAAGIPEQK